jgi:hypothetical protein
MKALAIGIVVAALSWLGGAVLTPRPVTSTWCPLPVTPSHLGAATDEDGDVDAYGNEVTSAVATYSWDAVGSPYEVHAPQVDLARPASPKS